MEDQQRRSRVETVSIVIVTYNSESVVASLLESIPRGHEIICVDNGSRDKTLTIVSRYPARIVKQANVGYGRACNVGAKEASGEFVLIMNPDVILRADTIANLRRAAEAYGSDVFFPLVEDGDGHLTFRDYNRIEGRGRRTPRAKRVLPSGDCCTRFVDGCIFMIRKDLFEEIGGFDPNIFLYYEDDDLSFRLLAGQRPLVLVESARATHLVSRSSRPTFKGAARMSTAKKVSKYYIARKYGLRRSPWVEGAFEVANLILAALTFSPTRIGSAYGRLRGVAKVIRIA